jgi:ABC-2 type transport system permease protein
LPEAAAWSDITEAQIAEIRFDGLPGDTDLAAPLAPASAESNPALAGKLAAWAPGNLDDAGQSIRNLVSLAAVADLCADAREAEIARLVLRRISGGFDAATARQALAWIILSPDDGQVVRRAPELGLFRHPPERLVRQRSAIYASKYLGRLTGKIPD